MNHKLRLPKTKYYSVNNLNHLEYNGIDTVELAKQYGTPLYVMNETGIREKCKILKENFIDRYDNTEVLYASKAFTCLEIYRIIQEEGIGCDVVSAGEIYTAYKAGFEMSRIYFHGNNKSKDEIELAIKLGIKRIVIDSEYEMELVNEVAKKEGIIFEVLLRVSPGIEVHTHEYLQTGVLDCKFGFPIIDYAHKAIKKLSTYDHLNYVGIHCHIGSQIFMNKGFIDASKTMMKLINEFLDLGYVTNELNLGGGFGIRYTKDDEYLDVVNTLDLVMDSLEDEAKILGIKRPKIIIEPGRWIVGDNGITLYEVGSEKNIHGVRKYVSVDGGMTDNPRPSLYKAEYQSILASHVDCEEEELITLAGKCCESGDILIKDIMMPKLNAKDIIAVLSTGAYNFSMASNYNRYLKPAVIMLHENKAKIVVKRETLEDLLKNDI